MLNFLNKNEGLISAAGIIITILLFFFSDNKIYVEIFLLFLFLLGIVYYFLYRKNKILSVEEIRNKAKILFIDDKECPVVINLQRNNFDVRKVDDVENTQDVNVLWANLVFVDYKGVGQTLAGKKEGLGLINLLEKDHPEKRYIIYSSIQDFDGVVNYPYIRKNAEYDEFVSLISEEISQI